MNSVTENAVRMFFPDDELQKIAWRTLREHRKNRNTVAPLQILALKTIMAERLSRGIGSETLFSLVFREPIKLRDRADIDPQHTLIERGVQMCFSDNKIQKIVCKMIDRQNGLESETVDSLQAIALKSIMTRTMKQEIGSSVLYSLIFNEKVSIWEFVDPNQFSRRPERAWQRFRRMFIERHKRSVQKIPNVFQELRTDPHLMYTVIGRTLAKTDWLHILIGRDRLRIRYHISRIAEIPHGKGEEFDVYWARKFARLAFSKQVAVINLVIEGEPVFGYHYMRDFLNRLVATLKPVVPPEGWEQAFQNGKSPIYQRNTDHSTDDFASMIAQFALAEHYDATHKSFYWGHIQ